MPPWGAMGLLECGPRPCDAAAMPPCGWCPIPGWSMWCGIMPPWCPIGPEWWCMGWCMGNPAADPRCGCWIGPWPKPPAFCCHPCGPKCEVCSFFIICICCSSRWLKSTIWSLSFTLTWYAMKNPGFCSSNFCQTSWVNPGSILAWYWSAKMTSFSVMYCCRHRSMRFWTYWMSAQVMELLPSGPSLALPAPFFPFPSPLTFVSAPARPPLAPPARFEGSPPALSFFARAMPHLVPQGGWNGWMCIQDNRKKVS
mmetsp:Transcript_1321/g.4590  ORF Transcript_1321/g.4590 Transcript_1321/m.4590 type:complete len:254 (-) Transcript_1321:521-1282(-)